MRRVRTVLLFAASLSVTLGICDVYLQSADIQTPLETAIDAQLGPTYIPGKRMSRFNEGFYLGEANVYGYMGPSVPPRRSGTERRVLLLGDSFVLGHTVLPRHHFARALEAALEQVTGAPVRALNFGKAGFNLSNMYAYFADFAGSFDHDLALFFVSEDDLLPARQLAAGLYPVVKLDGEALVIDTSFRESRTYGFYRAIEPVFTCSAVLRLVFIAYKMVKRGELPAVLFDKLAPAIAAATAAAGPPPAPAHALPATGSMSPLSLAILRELARDSRNVIVIQEALPAALHEQLTTIGMPVLDLGDAIAAVEARGEDLHYWPVTKMRGHCNHHAHRFIAQFLAGELPKRRLLWPACD